MAESANLNIKLSLENASFISGIENSRNATKRLLSQLDPVAAATLKVRREQELLENEMKAGRLSTEQYGLALERLNGRYQQHIRGLQTTAGASGQARAGLQQLSFQLGDVATQFAAGTSPMIIFAQQSGQVIQAIQLMAGETKGFLGFLASPWMQIITAATIVLTPFIGKLLDSGDAAKEAKLATDALGSAQSAMGDIFDLTTGKIKSQNEVLLLNARIMANTLKMEGLKANADAASALAKTGQPSFGAEAITVLSRHGSGGAIDDLRQRASQQRDVLNAVKNAKTPQERIAAENKAVDWMTRMSGRQGFAGLPLDETQTREALFNMVNGPEKTRLADLMTQSLDSGKLAGGLTRPGTGADHTTEKAAREETRYTRELQGLQAQHLNLLGQLTNDVGEQARIAHERNDADLDAYQDELAQRVLSKDITEEHAKALAAEKEKTTELQRIAINRKYEEQMLDEDLANKRAEHENALVLLRGQLGLVRTQEERRQLQLQILAQEMAEQREAIDRALLSKDLTKAERARLEAKKAQLGQEEAQQTAGIDQQNMGAWAQWLDSLPRTMGEVNEAFQHAAASGLANFNDGIASAIASGKSLGDVFKQVANQIIADLIRIGLQFAESKLFNGSNGSSGGDFLSSLGNAVGNLFGNGGGGGGSSSGVGIPQFAGGGSLMIGGRGGVDTNVLSINGVPRAMVSSNERLHVTPANDRGSGNTYYLSGNLLTPEFWAQVQDEVAVGSARVYTQGARRMGAQARQTFR